MWPPCWKMFKLLNHNLKLTRVKLFVIFKNMSTETLQKIEPKTVKECSITEGLVTVNSFTNVFYNPVQEFNRDLSISVLKCFAQECHNKESGNSEPLSDKFVSGQSNEKGITVLEAFSATGLRSIRYAKEINGLKQIVANDISKKAVECMRHNINKNGMDDLITPCENEATALMYKHRDKLEQFDVIDLDPYGCPSRFLDSAVQAVKEGGMLFVTATDMAILAGNSPETCYNKYGAVSLRTKSCHEVALRILLQCIESHANRYGRYIEPILSISADFYIRVFVKVYSGLQKCKASTSKLSMMFQCVGCDTITLQPLGVTKPAANSKQIQFKLPTGPPISQNCAHCQSTHHMGGPIWSHPIHNQPFIKEVLNTIPDHLKTKKRMIGILTLVMEELQNVPLYYVLEKLTGILHVETPPMMVIRSAILHAGYEVSFAHSHKTSIKTNAPAAVIWDIMRCWQLKVPITAKRREEVSPGNKILAIEPQTTHCFDLHKLANPMSRREGFLRFQENPLPYWGPAAKSIGAIIPKQKCKKRKHSDDS